MAGELLLCARSDPEGIQTQWQVAKQDKVDTPQDLKGLLYFLVNTHAASPHPVSPTR